MLRIFHKSCRAFLPNQHFSEVRGKITRLWGWKRNWGVDRYMVKLRVRSDGNSSQLIPLIAISLVIQLHNYHSQPFYSRDHLYQPGHYSIF